MPFRQFHRASTHVILSQPILRDHTDSSTHYVGRHGPHHLSGSRSSHYHLVSSPRKRAKLKTTILWEASWEVTLSPVPGSACAHTVLSALCITRSARRCQLLRRQAMDDLDAHRSLPPKIPSCCSIFTASSVHCAKLQKSLILAAMSQEVHHRIGR